MLPSSSLLPSEKEGTNGAVGTRIAASLQKQDEVRVLCQSRIRTDLRRKAGTSAQRRKMHGLVSVLRRVVSSGDMLERGMRCLRQRVCGEKERGKGVCVVAGSGSELREKRAVVAECVSKSAAFVAASRKSLEKNAAEVIIAEIARKEPREVIAKKKQA